MCKTMEHYETYHKFRNAKPEGATLDIEVCLVADKETAEAVGGELGVALGKLYEIIIKKEG